MAQSQNKSETSRLSLDLKLNVIKYAEENGVNAAAQKYHIDLRSIQDWFSGRFVRGSLKYRAQNKNKVRKKYKKKRHVRVGGKSVSVKMENLLASWVTEQQESDILTTIPMIHMKALELFKAEHQGSQKNFKASRTWVEGFLKRKKLNLESNNLMKNNNLPKTAPRTFTSDFKLSAVQHAQKFGVVAAAGEYYVDPKSIREWCRGHKIKKAIKQMANLSSGKKDVPAVPCTFTKGFKYEEENDSLATAKENAISESITEGHKLKNTKQKKNSSVALSAATRGHVARIFSLDFKLNVIKYAEENGIKAAAKKYCVHRKSVYEWCRGQKLKKVLEQMRPNKNTTGKKCANKYISLDKKYCGEEIENVLALWILELRQNNVLVTEKMIKVKALELLKSEYKENFHPTFKWVREFLRRKKLSLKSSANVQETISKNKVSIKTKHHLKNRYSSLLMAKQKSENTNESGPSVSDLNWTPKELKTVKAKKRKLIIDESKFKKRKSTEHVSSCDQQHFISCTSFVAINASQNLISNGDQVSEKANGSNSICNVKHDDQAPPEKGNISLSQNLICNVANKDQTSVKLNELFSQNSPTVDRSFTKIEPKSENVSFTVNASKAVHPMTVQGLIARIAFETYFNRKHV